MSLPPTIRVGPHSYRVVIVPDGILEGAGSDATCNPRHLVIALDGEQPPTAMGDSILHELTHAMLATVPLDETTEEAICLALAPALLGMLRDNPDLVSWLTD